MLHLHFNDILLWIKHPKINHSTQSYVSFRVRPCELNSTKSAALTVIRR